jgi:thiamine pyrophosphokinase
MKIGLYAALDNGPVKDHSIDYIAVDQGLSHLHEQGITPILAIGDFDSLVNQALLEKLKVERYPVRKDDTDTALAISYCVEAGYDEIDVYGVCGGRLDHLISVLITLRKYPDVKIHLYDQKNRITLLPKGDHWITSGYHYFSLYAYTPTHLTLENCAYPLENYLLNPDDPLVTSNQCEGTLHVINDHNIYFFESSDEAS